MCQNITISNSKHVYRQSQLRKPTITEVKWVNNRSSRYMAIDFKLSRFVSGHSVYWRIGVWDFLNLKPAFSRGRQLVSFDPKIACLCQSIEIKKYACMHECMHACMYACMYVCMDGWMDGVLHSAEEDYLSPFDSNIARLCQSIEINNNKHVYRQSQVRMPNGNGIEWAECSLIIGTRCQVQVF